MGWGQQLGELAHLRSWFMLSHVTGYREHKVYMERGTQIVTTPRHTKLPTQLENRTLP